MSTGISASESGRDICVEAIKFLLDRKNIQALKKTAYKHFSLKNTETMNKIKWSMGTGTRQKSGGRKAGENGQNRADTGHGNAAEIGRPRGTQTRHKQLWRAGE